MLLRVSEFILESYQCCRSTASEKMKMSGNILVGSNVSF